MGLTYEQAKALGLAHLWPKKVEVESFAIPPPASKAPRDGMNKLERAFWERASEAKAFGVFDEVWREPIKLRLAGNTSYLPDFMTAGQGELIFWETKGRMRDDAAVKLKVAAAQFQCFKWVLVQRQGVKWVCREVTNTGFSRAEFCPEWLRR